MVLEDWACCAGGVHPPVPMGRIFCLHFMLIILFQRNVRNGHKLTWIVYRCFTHMERKKKRCLIWGFGGGWFRAFLDLPY